MTGTIFSSSVLIATIILARRVFMGKISRRLQYALWLPVALRLLIPFPLMASPLSVMNAVNVADVKQAAGRIRVPVRVVVPYTREEYSIQKKVPVSEIVDSDLEIDAHRRASIPLANALEILWSFGAVATGIWFVGVNALFYERLRKQRTTYDTQTLGECKLPIYTVDNLQSPCLFGVFRPAVYLSPASIKTTAITEHVVTHELCHHAHGDHLWSLARGLCLALHWFNPLVWLAAAISRVDCELACDEAVVKRLGENNRISYGRTLLDMVAEKQGPATLLCAGTTMASRRQSLMERINLIARNQKRLIAPLIAALVMITVAVGCTFTGAQKTPSSPGSQRDVLPGANQGKSLAEKIRLGLGNPNPLIHEAWIRIQMDIESQEELSKQVFGEKSTKFTDAEITALKMTKSFDTIEEGAVIQAYLLQYRMLPKDPSKVVLVGGEAMKDGWLLSQGSTGDQQHLVVRSKGRKVSYLGSVNPEPDSGYGLLDSTLELLYMLKLKEDRSLVASSPMQIKRAFAVDDVDQTPEKAAELLTMNFTNWLCLNDDLANPQYKTFIVTDLKDVSFKIYPTTGAPSEYRLKNSEIGDKSWIVEISASYRYKGTISPIGDGSSIPPDQWVTELYQGSRVGFLMRKESGAYTLRSRYE